MQAELEAVVTENVNLDDMAVNEDDDIPLGFEANDPGVISYRTQLCHTRMSRT